MKTVSTDGVMIRETHLLGNEGHGLLTMDKTIRKTVLDRNAALRNEPEALRHLDAMGWELSIPFEDYYNLQMKYPDLKSKDAQIRTLAWSRFMNTSEAIPYRVRDRA
jgi:hypothetical protein